MSEFYLAVPLGILRAAARALDAGRVRSRKIRCSIDEPLSPGSARHAVRLGSRLVDAEGSIDGNPPVFSLWVRMNKNAQEAFHSPASQGGTMADSCGGGGDRDENTSTSWRMAGGGNDDQRTPLLSGRPSASAIGPRKRRRADPAKKTRSKSEDEKHPLFITSSHGSE